MEGKASLNYLFHHIKEWDARYSSMLCSAWKLLSRALQEDDVSLSVGWVSTWFDDVFLSIWFMPLALLLYLAWCSMNSAKEAGTAILGHSLGRTPSNVAWEITGIEVFKKEACFWVWWCTLLILAIRRQSRWISMSSRLNWSLEQVPKQPGLHCDSLFPCSLCWILYIIIIITVAVIEDQASDELLVLYKMGVKIIYLSQCSLRRWLM